MSTCLNVGSTFFLFIGFDENSGNACQCTDDVGKIWEAKNKEEIVLKECSEFQPNLIGNQTWTCGNDGQFIEDFPNRSKLVQILQQSY